MARHVAVFEGKPLQVTLKVSLGQPLKGGAHYYFASSEARLADSKSFAARLTRDLDEGSNLRINRHQLRGKPGIAGTAMLIPPQGFAEAVFDIVVTRIHWIDLTMPSQRYEPRRTAAAMSSRVAAKRIISRPQRSVNGWRRPS